MLHTHMSTKLHNVYIILLSQSSVYNYLVFSYTTSPFLTYLCHSVNRSGGLTETLDRECVCIACIAIRIAILNEQDMASHHNFLYAWRA